ncbi:MAG: c-type cytochrome [Sterolibacterium sp.]|nr:c-type cytochrome [Sterolibacterium sp.]
MWDPRITVVSIIACLLCSSAAVAVEMPELAKKNNCVNCHAIKERLVGPAWLDISKRYMGDPSAEEKLLARVSKGSSGFFGLIHMPANDPDGYKQAEMRELVKFILGLSSSKNTSGSPVE